MLEGFRLADAAERFTQRVVNESVYALDYGPVLSQPVLILLPGMVREGQSHGVNLRTLALPFLACASDSTKEENRTGGAEKRRSEEGKMLAEENEAFFLSPHEIEASHALSLYSTIHDLIISGHCCPPRSLEMTTVYRFADLLESQFHAKTVN